MDLNSISFASHDSCEALTASIQGLPASTRRQKVRTIRGGETLWQSTDKPSQVFILEEGRVEISETDQAGRATVMQVIHPGEMFGYLCFCDHRSEPHGTEARAVVSSKVSRTDYRDFRAALNRSAETALRLTEALCNRVAEAERRTRMLSIHDARKRLATLLQQLATVKLAALPGTHDIVSLHVSHAELAARAALTRPHTTVLMTRLRETGCVSYERGTAIKIHLGKLRKLTA